MDSLSFTRAERERFEAPEDKDQVAQCECCGEEISGEHAFVRGFSYHHECLLRRSA